MGLIAIVLLVILVVSAILLVLVVLVQDEQGEGLGGIFGGGSTTPFGSRSGNVLTRFTAILATVFLVCTLGLAWVNRTPEAGNVIGRARQESLKTSEKQTWWVQTAAAPGGVSTPGATAAPAPNTAPGGSSPSPQAPAAGSRQAPPPSNQEGN